MRTGLVDEIVARHRPSPTSSSRRRPSRARPGSSSTSGPSVNLGNIPPDEVIPLETLRLGLRGDTLQGGAARWRAGRPPLPELDYEAMPAEEILRALLEAFPGRVSLACSFQKEESVLLDMLFAARPGRARLRARHPRPLPRDLRRLARGRAALRHRGRGLRGPVARPPGRAPRRGALGAQARPLLRDPQGRAARPGARRPRRAGSPACAATSRRRGPTRRRSAGTTTTSSGRQTRSPTGTTRAASPTSPSATFPTTSCTTAATPRSAAPTARSRARAARAAGRAATRPSAACTRPAARPEPRAEEARPVAEPRAYGLRPLAHRALGRRQVDDREPRRRGARGARRPRRPPRRRRRPRAPLARGSASRRRTATRTSSGSAGSPRGSPAPARRSSSRRSPPTRRRGGRRARSPRSTRRSSRCTSRPRSRSASAATRRASTRWPTPARSPASPASPTPTRSRSTRSCGCRPRAGRPRSRRRSSLAKLEELGLVADRVHGVSACTVEPADALAPRRARVGGDPHHARGRRRARAPGAALLRRQGLDRPAAPRREGLPAGAVPVPGHARRHRPQLPRGDRVPRPPRRRARRAARRRERPGLDRPRSRRRGDRPARVAQPAADDDAPRRDRRARLRRRDGRRAPRRGALAREGADLQLPRRLRPVEPPRAAARALEPLQRADPQGRAHPRLPDLELDRARRLAVHRPRAARAALDLLRPRASGLPPRRDDLRGLRVRRAASRARSRSRPGCGSGRSAT